MHYLVELLPSLLLAAFQKQRLPEDATASLLSCLASNQLSTQQRMPGGLLKAAGHCSLEATTAPCPMEGAKDNVMAKPWAYEMTPLRPPLCQSDPENNRALPFKSSVT